MTDLGSPQLPAAARYDFLGRPLQASDKVCCLGQLLYRQADAVEFLQFLQYLCLNQASAAGILRLLGARQLVAAE
ncbi:hypothetical protein [Loigolactobacillus zhaoyuanensis]|uniref:Uncharacterized protein n=1 Tax=Loigolactobacillus zhaoyuanensis TaxID=2486017 RepID=A0ABW8UFP0_9LACO